MARGSVGVKRFRFRTDALNRCHHGHADCRLSQSLANVDCPVRRCNGNLEMILLHEASDVARA
jgi:hypothetical protein